MQSCTILAFFTENKESEHLTFCEFHGQYHLASGTHPHNKNYIF